MEVKYADMNVEYLDHMGSDINVVNAARCSFAKEVKEFDLDKDTKLINYLAKHNHWSPFAHTSVSIRVKAPIFVARQLVKHCVGGCWNEESRRYIDDEPEFYMPSVWRGKPVNAKQGSDGVVEDGWVQTELLKEHCWQSLYLYNSLLESNVAPEQARMVLPQNTMTNWVWTGSVMFFARVCKLRLDSHSQQETQEIAQKIDNILSSLYPVSWKALLSESKEE